MITIVKWLMLAAALLTLILWIWRMNVQLVPQVGTSAPDFTLFDQSGVAHTLAEYKGRWLVMYFYPKDDTPGCTKQACAFRDDIQQFRTLGAQVVGISVDSDISHAKFAKKYALPFTLLADAKAKIATRYGSLRNLGLLRFAQRNTFLIDPVGKIAQVYINVDPIVNPKQVVADLTSLQNK